MTKLTSKATIAIALAAFTGIRAALHLIDWAQYHAKGSTQAWREAYPLEPGIYEACPCQGKGFCVRCMDSGLVEHEC